jgi:membrane protein implicated in regulation of membrane protease activity
MPMPIIAVVSVAVNRDAGPVLQLVQTTALLAAQVAVSQCVIPVFIGASLLTCQVSERPLCYLALSDTLVNSVLLIVLAVLESVAGKRRIREYYNQGNSHQNRFNRM